MAQKTPFDRRGFMKIAGTYGLSSTAFAVAGYLGPLTIEGVGKAAAQTAATRSGTPLMTLKFGAAGFNEDNLKIQESGQLWFAKELEKRTEGALKIEFIGNNQICNQGDCVKKTQQGIVDLFTASTQNSAGSAPYYNVLDFAYMFPTRAAQHHFLYSKKSEKLLREPMRRLHNIQFLYSHCELRGLMMGKKFADKPTITSVEQLAGTKNRVTGTQLGRIAMTLMNLNPTPIAWEETLDGLKQGLIDGAETWRGSVRQHVAGAVAGGRPALLLRHRTHGDELRHVQEAAGQDPGYRAGSLVRRAAVHPEEPGAGVGGNRRCGGQPGPEHGVRQGRRAGRGVVGRRDQEGGANVFAGVPAQAVGRVARASEQDVRWRRRL